MEARYPFPPGVVGFMAKARAEMRPLGRENLRIAQHMLMALSIRPFLHDEGMAEETFQRLIAGAVSELRDSSLKLYYKV